MTKTLFAITLAVMLVDAAAAADYRRGPYTVSAPLSPYSWAGPYLGANLGYQWGATSNHPAKPSGIMGGAQAGYNWQSGRFVFGGEADLQLSAAHDRFAPWQFSNPWFGTLRGRIGVAMNDILFYGTLGIALGTVRIEGSNLEAARTHAGWAAGLGIEMGLTPHWSVRAEYLHVDLADRNYAITGTVNGLESNILRLGVNYRF
jgi:outer membrane immunogenic protein